MAFETQGLGMGALCRDSENWAWSRHAALLFGSMPTPLPSAHLPKGSTQGKSRP